MTDKDNDAFLNDLLQYHQNIDGEQFTQETLLQIEQQQKSRAKAMAGSVFTAIVLALVICFGVLITPSDLPSLTSVPAVVLVGIFSVLISLISWVSSEDF